jgi:hypothetical protein
MGIEFRHLISREKVPFRIKGRKGVLRIPGLDLETVVVIAFSERLRSIEQQEEPEAVTPELLDVFQLMQHPPPVRPELLRPGVVKMDGVSQRQGH